MADPKTTHRIDQSSAALSELAAVLASYHQSLMVEGFARAEALALVVAYQASFMANMNKGGDR